MKNVRDLKDSTIHDVPPIGKDSSQACKRGGVLHSGRVESYRGLSGWWTGLGLQGYLAHKKSPPPQVTVELDNRAGAVNFGWNPALGARNLFVLVSRPHASLLAGKLFFLFITLEPGVE